MSRKATTIGSVIGMLVLIAGMLAFLVSRWDVRLELVGQEEITVPYGSDYEDPGAMARVEGRGVPAGHHDLDVQTRGSVDTGHVGSYTVTYRASYLFYHGKAERVVHVEDERPPLLLLEERPESVRVGETWTDGFSAVDDLDGDITDAVRVEGAVDTNVPGAYTLTYTVTDAAGNTASARRTVTVTDEAEPVEGNRIVFLTFDDGPSQYTPQLLDTLAAHGVKATFFVIGVGEANNYLIAREWEEGHAVGVHSLTHSYSEIYASDEAFWADFDAMNDIIEAQTGHRTNIFRFPGGSSNTVSSGNPGIMTRLAREAEERGLQYFDWNVESGDAGRVDTADGVFQNIIDQCSYLDSQGYGQMVVLCHDSHKYTVDAMDRVLTWFEENGYTLLPLQKGIVDCRHTIAN